MRLSADTLKAGIDPEQYYRAMGVEGKGKPNGHTAKIQPCPFALPLPSTPCAR
jgi:hypothetical protein